jgi:hypothetical protein
MKRKNLPMGFRQRVRQLEQQRWAGTRGVDESKIVRDLPEALRRDIKTSTTSASTSSGRCPSSALPAHGRARPGEHVRQGQGPHLPFYPKAETVSSGMNSDSSSRRSELDQ